MGIEVKWFNESKTAVEISINSYEPTWVPFDGVVDHALKLSASVAHQVIIIVNPCGNPMPKSGPPIPHLRRLVGRIPPNVPFVVVVMGNLGYFESALGDILLRATFRGKLKHVAMPEEAYALIPKVA